MIAFSFNQKEKVKNLLIISSVFYFFILLFNLIEEWDLSARNEIEYLILSALDGGWPSYMKFRPMAILTLVKYNSDLIFQSIEKLLKVEDTPFWACRYACLMLLESNMDSLGLDRLRCNISKGLKDPNLFVRLKANSIKLR